MTHFPLFADLEDQPCLVVGGGDVAARKVDRLLRAAARVTVNAPRLCAALAARASAGEIRHAVGDFDPALVATQILIVAATSDRNVNRRVAAAAAVARRLCNVVDDGELSTCIMPAVADRSPVVIAVSSAGRAPVLARRLRQQIEAWLPARIGELAAWAGTWRAVVRDRVRSPAGRLRFWEGVFAGEPSRRVLAGDPAAADELMRNALNSREPRVSSRGAAWFVGAGPGDPGLLTARGLQLLQSADVIMHDRLVSDGVLELARRDARFIDVGKSPGGPSTSQESINRQLVDLVAAGHRVCRLKGGDPFIFGRGAEEVAAVTAAGQACEVVPGITAANGCAAAAGIPLTHRELSSAVTLIAAHRCGDGTAADADPDWPLLARGSHTLVIYMGVRRLAEISRILLQHGRPPATPAALIENGTTNNQRVVGGRLDDIQRQAEEAGIRSPALLVVGDVVGVADKLGWVAPVGDVRRSAAIA
ncbi:MAG: siroheme synthase CysG [Gammaproteobacteria bacterium]